MSYSERHGKSYRHKWVNAHQSPSERRAKYDFVKGLTGSSEFARVCRDRRSNRLGSDVATYLNHRGRVHGGK